MTLATRLAALKTDFIGRVPLERSQLIATAIERSRLDHVAANALRAGDRAPDFTLLDQAARTVRLRDRLLAGAAVVVFYRGGWCPYCNLMLREYQRLHADFERDGIQLIAISPQAPDASLSTAEKNGLGFTVLSDIGNAVARAFGIAYTLPPELQALYTEIGHALPELNGDDSWELPVPATFVIGPDGIVALGAVDLDYRARLEPADALEAARRSATGAVA